MANPEPIAAGVKTGRAPPPGAGRSDGGNSVETMAAARRTLSDGKDVAEETVKIAQDATRAGLQAASGLRDRSSDELKQNLDLWSRQGEDLARQSRQSLEAIAGCNSVVVRGVHDISRAWINLAQARVQRRVDSLNAFVRCRSAEDFVAAQGGLLHDGLEQIVDTNRRVTQIALETMEAAGKKMAAAVPQLAA